MTINEKHICSRFKSSTTLYCVTQAERASDMFPKENYIFQKQYSLSMAILLLLIHTLVSSGSSSDPHPIIKPIKPIRDFWYMAWFTIISMIANLGHHFTIFISETHPRARGLKILWRNWEQCTEKCEKSQNRKNIMIKVEGEKVLQKWGKEEEKVYPFFIFLSWYIWCLNL